MPSPVGHVLGGIASGVVVSGRSGWQYLILFAVLGAAADLDFLFPWPHRGPSHSIGATLIVFVIVLTLALGRNAVRPRSKPPLNATRLALAFGAAYGSHVLLDWLGADTSTPHGLMALWPFSQTFFISGLDVFNSVSRRYWLPGFWRANAVAVLREMVLLGPVAVLSFRGFKRE